ncbi:MAG: polymer-forming cytoskeletal protein [Spirochaetota bacterium]|jgi:cytoskeletal protein CcmA (bactofilin family)|nr:polymer-forming cytoskeletal protein [Spirochaetota bacterium]
MGKTVPGSYEELEELTSTVMSPDVEFIGDIRFKTSLMIKGRVKGTIRAEGHLIVAPGAVLEGSVEAARVTSYGSITGDVLTSECFAMKKGATQTGDILSPGIMVELGCCLNGDVRMQKP